MAEIGKYAPDLKGFPTPNEAADEASYLLLYFQDKEWAQYALGALKVLQFGYNWYKSGDLDPDEAADLFKDILNDAPYNLKTCSNPAGGKIIRVAPSGHVEQLGDTNEWEDPTGDYAIPPVPPRTDGTPPDQNCLAAKNAAHVLELLYENVSDSFAEGLNAAEAGVALIASISLLVGVEFAPITFAIVSVSAAIFGAFYSIMEFVTADLWDENFTGTLVCILRSCLTNDDGVITFDWDCFNAKLAAQVEFTSLTFDQLRLFGQIQYLLFMVGGVDALNLAGATTAITDDDCDYCDEWCYTFDFTLNDGDWDPVVISGLDFAVYSSGNGWSVRTQNDGCSNHSYMYMTFPISADNISRCEIEFADSIGSFDVALFDQLLSGTLVQRSAFANGDAVVHSTGDVTPVIVDHIGITLNKCDTPSGWYTVRATFHGLGVNPFGSDNC